MRVRIAESVALARTIFLYLFIYFLTNSQASRKFGPMKTKKQPAVEGNQPIDRLAKKPLYISSELHARLKHRASERQMKLQDVAAALIEMGYRQTDGGAK